MYRISLNHACVENRVGNLEVVTAIQCLNLVRCIIFFFHQEFGFVG